MTTTDSRAFTVSCRDCGDTKSYPEGDTIEAINLAQSEFFAEHECLAAPKPLPKWVQRELENEALLMAAERLQQA